MEQKTQHLYAFDLFTLDAGRGVLYRDGEMIPLTQKALDLLRVLVERSPETVSKEELLQSVWSGTFVEEANLTQHVSMLRKALGETPQERRYISTVPGIGYRFVAPIRKVGATESVAVPPETHGGAEPIPSIRPEAPRPESRWSLWRWAAYALVLVIAGGVAYRLYRRVEQVSPPKGSILVADFENSTGDAVFDSALEDALSLQLGQSPYLEIVPTERVQETLRQFTRSSGKGDFIVEFGTGHDSRVQRG